MNKAMSAAGIDLDYEPASISCSVKSGVVSCNTDTQQVQVATALRNAFPIGQYIFSAATWHVGMYGESQGCAHVFCIANKCPVDLSVLMATSLQDHEVSASTTGPAGCSTCMYSKVL